MSSHHGNQKPRVDNKVKEVGLKDKRRRTTMFRILVYGIGNPGRRDDGLGPKLVSLIETEGIKNVDCDSNYQLNIEDALTCSHYDAVVFVDASENAAPPFEFTELGPAREMAYTTHEISPSSVLALTEELYARRPRAWLMAIRGYEWDLAEGLSPQAEDNFRPAAEFLIKFLIESGTASSLRALAA
jgi:hydrogenase maturation protease